jgi:hypothetical protein
VPLKVGRADNPGEPWGSLIGPAPSAAPEANSGPTGAVPQIFKSARAGVLNLGTLSSESDLFFVKLMRSRMDGQTKRDIWFIALSTLMAAPLIAGVGLVVVSGIVAW